MPIPIFIVAADSSIEDRRSNQLSLIGTIEAITANPKAAVRDAKMPPQPSTHSTIAISWLREPEDEGRSIHHVIAFHIPGHPKEVVVQDKEFRFDSMVQRFFLRMAGWPPFKESGVMRIESRVRREGSTEWISQSCPIFVDFDSAANHKDKQEQEASQSPTIAPQ